MWEWRWLFASTLMHASQANGEGNEAGDLDNLNQPDPRTGSVPGRPHQDLPLDGIPLRCGHPRPGPQGAQVRDHLLGRSCESQAQSV